MQAQHCQCFGFILRGKLFEEEHPRVVDENVNGQAFRLAESQQLFSGRFRGQILIMRNDLYGAALCQFLGGPLQLRFLVTDQQ